MVEVTVPGYRWEIEFSADGTVEGERFESRGVAALDDRQIEDLLRSWDDR